MNAKGILDLLRVKHSGDVFVSECKNGGNQGLRMDVWAMKKSWANPLTVAYEIKVSRSDFINDNKWHRYLDYCNQFYFVCPAGVIKPEELPEEAGLMYVASTGSRIVTKKKSPYRRGVVVPENLYRYILMNRVEIVDSTFNGIHQETTADFWRKYMEKKRDDTNFGHRVSKRIREVIIKRIHKVEDENLGLQEENQKLREMKEFCEQQGIDLRNYNPIVSLRERLGIPISFIQMLNQGIKSLQALRDKMED